MYGTTLRAICEKHGLKVVRIHTHIGSGSDPAVWQKTSGMSLDLCREFPTVETLNLGGGYKVGRMAYEKSTDLAVVGAPVKALFEAFAKDTGRELRLEIEPGTFLLANSCAIVCTVQDKVTTGAASDGGHVFLKLDAGMTEVLRPSLYAAQHPLVTVSAATGKEPEGTDKYVVVGHCCESGDLMTPGPDDAEEIAERAMGEVERGDNGWVSLMDDDGYVYYHNERTGDTTWQRPANLKDFVELAEGQGSGDEA